MLPLPTPRLKSVILLLSTKKGLFSAKKVSKAVRLTSEGSASTCPKSGLTVRLRMVLFDNPIFASRPAFAFRSLPSAHGLSASPW